MIKGKYVCLVTIDFHIDENRPGLLPLDEIKERVHQYFDADIQELISDEMQDQASVSVEQKFLDVYLSKEE